MRVLSEEFASNQRIRIVITISITIEGDPIAQLFRAATVDLTGSLIHDPVHFPDS